MLTSACSNSVHVSPLGALKTSTETDKQYNAFNQKQVNAISEDVYSYSEFFYLSEVNVYGQNITLIQLGLMSVLKRLFCTKY